MDPDVRSNQPGNCRRCGMKLREGIPEPVEFHMDLALTPRAVKPNQTEQLKFSVHDPWKDRPVKDFQIVHEKLFHMFVVSQDLQFFVHDHPVITAGRRFSFNARVSEARHVSRAGRFLSGWRDAATDRENRDWFRERPRRRPRFRAIIRPSKPRTCRWK